MATPELVKVGQRTTAQGWNDVVQAVLDVQAAVTEALPIVSMRSSGDAQPITANTVIGLYGNQGGWVFDINAGGNDIAGEVGISASPIVIKQPGLYLLSWTVIHQQVATGRAFTETNFSVPSAVIYGTRSVWSLDDTSSISTLIPVNNLSADLRVNINDYSNVGNATSLARVTCIKVHD